MITADEIVRQEERAAVDEIYAKRPRRSRRALPPPPPKRRNVQVSMPKMLVGDISALFVYMYL